jgi:nicotinamidase-related amidase
MTGSATPRLGDDVALVVVDAQVGFDDPARGPRNNHHCDRNIAGLVAAFVATDRPVVFVRHESASPASSLHPRHPGNALKPYLERHTPDLVVTKTVHSSFHGSPDLDAWLRTRRIGGLVVAGITTNHCCETTARVGANLGYAVRFVLDATHTFDLVGPDGITLTADELARATATNLHEQFATIVTTRQVVDAVGPGHDR